MQFQDVDYSYIGLLTIDIEDHDGVFNVLGSVFCGPGRVYLIFSDISEDIGNVSQA